MEEVESFEESQLSKNDMNTNTITPKTAINRLDRIFLIITNSCNSRCLLCDYWLKKPKKVLPLSFIQEEIVPLIQKYQVKVVCITGGEPTLHPQLTHIIKALRETGVHITLITNCTGLPQIFDTIKYSVDAYMFPFDASNESLYREIRGVDNFGEIVSWPERIKADVPSAQIAFSCLVQKKNIEDLVDIYLLASRLPIDALFLRAPELKTYSFGRQGSTLERSFDNAHLTEEEIEILDRNLKKMLELDSEKGKLRQGDVILEKFVKYFEALRGNEVEFTDRVCEVPFENIVIDESQCVYPCFYFPFSVPFNEVKEDIINNGCLGDVREKILKDKEFRKQYCNLCLQFR